MSDSSSSSYFSSRQKGRRKIQRKREGGAHAITELKSILPAVGDALGLAQKTQEMAVLALWHQQISSKYQGKTRPLRLKQQAGQWVLQVIVSDGAIASELSFALPEITARINLFSVQTGIQLTRIELGVGTV